MTPLVSMFLILVIAGAVGAQDPPVSKVITTQPEQSGIWNGQKVAVNVELLAPGYFVGVPVFDLPSVPGCLIVPPTGSPVVGTREIDGTSFTTQLHHITVYPRKAGTIEIPPFDIRFEFKSAPLDQETKPQTVTTGAIRFTAGQPPGMSEGNLTLTSSDLAIEETWKPVPTSDARTGDAFVRTIRWRAGDLSGMAFPPFPSDPVHGMGIYRSGPVVEDHSERGTTTGMRQETITYICKTAGTITIPGYQFRWWNPSSRKIGEISFPAHNIRVTAPPVPPEPPLRRLLGFLRIHRDIIIGCALLSAFLITLSWIYRIPIRTFFTRFRPNHLPPLNPDPGA